MNTAIVNTEENERLALQEQLDSQKTQLERNQLGQFATPTILATDILRYALKSFSARDEVRFLDPAIGTGAFFSALDMVSKEVSVPYQASGYEIDPQYGMPSKKLWEGYPLNYQIADFTKAVTPKANSQKADLVICNPPYVRHHHITAEDKAYLYRKVLQNQGVKLSGLSGLYCYFLCLSQSWMKPGAIAGWLVPSEFMDVNYGVAVKRFLTEKVSLFHIHRFHSEDVQFSDALVSSSIVWFRNTPCSHDQNVRFTLGGTLTAPKIDRNYSVAEISKIPKWTGLPETGKRIKKTVKIRFKDLFTIKRGIATGSNKFFIISPAKNAELGIPPQFLKPILPSPRYIQTNCIEADSNGNPILDRFGFLFSSDLPEEMIKKKHPKVWEYLQLGQRTKVHEGYICSHRTPWYNQEFREPAPFLCTYMGRSTDLKQDVFRFILNKSNAIAANVLLMIYPNESLKYYLNQDPTRYETVWKSLNAIPAAELVSEGRIYGGGLYKMEPKELLNTPADSIAEAIGYTIPTRCYQNTLFDL